ncbi:hypothetical protein EWM64_g10236, partial [Hericium alpestre]
MYRALPVARQAASPASKGLVRVSRRRFATETSETVESAVPKKKKHIVRRLVLYTAAATTTYYVGSAFVAFNNPVYYDFFINRVPFGPSVIEFGENHGWDNLTLQDVVDNTIEGGIKTYTFARKQLGYASEEVIDEAKKAEKKAEQKVKGVKDATEKAVESGEGILDRLKTDVHVSKVHEKSVKAAAIAKHRAEQFSEGVDDLIHKAEHALSSESPIASQPEATTTPGQPTNAVPHVLGPKEGELELETTEFVEQPKKSDKDVYDAPLPIGFEPPPGYKRPTPPKPAAEPEQAAGAVEPLPLVAPVVAGLSSSEPVISHLASTIDNLAAFLNNNPAAATQARGVLDTARTDLTELAHDFDKLREEEQHKLEQELDEQARQYTLKLLEIELDAQDKLDHQEAGFKEYLDEEKAKFAQAYREKLDRELETQREIINERLKEEVIAQGIELQRRWIRDIKVHVEQERGGRLAKLDELAANLKRLERIALDNSTY